MTPSVNRIPLFILLLLASCDNTDKEPAKDPCADNSPVTIEPCATIETVTADQCLIQEALIHNPAGDLTDKFVYHHDGTNYDRIDRYYPSNTDPALPTEVINFSYQDGLISEVRSTAAESPGITWVWTYTYVDSTRKTHFDILEADGSVEFTTEFEEFYLLNPPNSLYYYDGLVFDIIDRRALFEYNAGNVVRKGTPSNNGACTMHGAKWVFAKNYFDDVPNVLKNYAVRYPLMEGKGLYGTMTDSYAEISTNNIIGRIYEDGQQASYCWTFLKNGTGSYWIKEFGVTDGLGTITYHYDCE